MSQSHHQGRGHNYSNFKSRETADTSSILEIAKLKGEILLSISNVVSSSMARLIYVEEYTYCFNERKKCKATEKYCKVCNGRINYNINYLEIKRQFIAKYSQNSFKL